MTLALNLPPDLESRLQNEAERQGLPAATLTLQLLDQHLPSKNPQEELARLLQSWIVEGTLRSSGKLANTWSGAWTRTGSRTAASFFLPSFRFVPADLWQNIELS